MKEMKVLFAFLVLTLMICMACNKAVDEIDDPDYYLAKKHPGEIPALFAPELISTEGIQHCFPTFSPSGDQVFWMTIPLGKPPTIMLMKLVDGKWTKPSVAPFSGEFRDQSPFFSRNGSRVYYSSSRPGGYGKMDIWYVEKNEYGWSEPINLGSPPNTAESESQPTMADNGNLYFVSHLENVKWNIGIYRSRFENGTYIDRTPLPENINTEFADSYPFISSDERFLMFGSGRPGIAGSETDIFLSLHDQDDSWQQPIRLPGSINNGFTATFPSITSDGKYFFFNRFDESGTDVFFWADIKVLEGYIN